MVLRRIVVTAALVGFAACGEPAVVRPNGLTPTSPSATTPIAGSAVGTSTATVPTSNSADPNGNAATLVVPMSMQIPKMPRTPVVSTPMNPATGVPGAPAAPGAPTAPGAPAAGAAAPPVVMGDLGEPVIPEIKGECPPLDGGPINFMGVTGQVDSGPMPSSPTAPMLLYWHGTGSTAGEYVGMAAAIAQGVTSQGGVIVSFQNTTNKGDCSPSGTFIFCTGDFEVMDQYVACAVKNRNVDPHRIYTAGCSAGGLMATAMAAQRSQYIAAAAPNSGGLAIPSQFSSGHIPALMTIHGAPGGDVVVIDFSQSSATADMLFKQKGGFVINCNHGGAHCGGGGLAGDAWKFFQAHPFGIDPEPWAGGLPAGFASQCMIM